MTTTERVIAWARQGVDMELMTTILRGEGVPDTEIRAAYSHMATLGPTEVIRGQYYMRILPTSG